MLLSRLKGSDQIKCILRNDCEGKSFPFSEELLSTAPKLLPLAQWVSPIHNSKPGAQCCWVAMAQVSEMETWHFLASAAGRPAREAKLQGKPDPNPFMMEERNQGMKGQAKSAVESMALGCSHQARPSRRTQFWMPDLPFNWC